MATDDTDTSGSQPASHSARPDENPAPDQGKEGGDPQTVNNPETPKLPRTWAATQARLTSDITRTGTAIEPPPPEVYELLWREFLNGTRGYKVLARVCGVGSKVAHRAVMHGWPDRQWPSLRSRLDFHERQTERARASQMAAADTKSAEDLATTQREAWREFLPQGLKTAAESMQVLGILGTKLRQAMTAATFVKFRKVHKVVKDDDGKHRTLTESQAYVDGVAVSKAAGIWAGAIKESASVMSFLTGGPSARAELAAPDLTPDQVAEIAAGRLPDGLTVEMVARAVIASGALVVGKD